MDLKVNWRLLGWIALLILPTLACAVPGFEQGAPAGTPTPIGDTMYFNIPAFAYNLAPGESVPGAGLQYVDRRGDAYEVKIDGQAALKRTGDSFFWSGVMTPGVFANYNLRLTSSVFGSMPVAGSVEVIVLNPNPVEQSSVPVTENIISLPNVVVDYTVPVGYQIPGTTLVYEGVEERGQGGQTTSFARLSGTISYPFLALGDSLVWTGKLLDNVYVRYNLRVTSLKEDALRLTGTAELWIAPPG